MSTNALNPTPFNTPAFTPRSAMIASYPEATGYAMGYQLERDTFHPTATPEDQHRNRYEQALANQRHAPWYTRIGANAIIFPTAIIGAGILTHQIGKLPAIEKALNHPNWWISGPANFANMVANWGLMEWLIEFGTIGFWSHFW
jgi:hypothetical protein